jgi:hypothetical protein
MLGSLTIPLPVLQSYVRDWTNHNTQGRRSIKNLIEYRERLHKPSEAQGARMRLAQCFLDLARQRECKDGRDRVYGMLGIASDVGVVPDYSLSLEEVYIKFVFATLNSGDFSTLHECCIGHNDRVLPSYVPMLNSCQCTHMPDRGDRFRSALGRSCSVKWDLRRIAISGARIDKVQAAVIVDHVTSWKEFYEHALSHIVTNPEERLQWQADLKVNSSKPQFRRLPYSNHSFLYVLLQTLNTDDYRRGGDMFTRFMRKEDHRNVLFTMICNSRLKNQSLFWTKKGFIGFGPIHLQPGDEVVVFDGDYMPFLLREQCGTRAPHAPLRTSVPRYGQRGTTSESCKIVGHCYLHGWMYGTFPDKAVAGDQNEQADTEGIIPEGILRTLLLNH